MDSIRCFVSKTPTNWDECLPRIVGALRSAVNRSTGYTANMLMLGREMNQPVDLVFPHPSFSDQIDCDQYVAELSENIKLKNSVTGGTYCVCRGPDTGSFMIQCNECREWYHGTCVKVTAEQAKTIDIYECPPCTDKPSGHHNEKQYSSCK